MFDTIKNAIGISVTFNSHMPKITAYCDEDPISALALRIFYSYFVDPKKCRWSPFVTSVESMKFHLDEVIDFILADIDKHFDAKSRHVILCADEILLCLDQRVPNEKVKDHFNLLVGQIGSILESNTRVHFVLSSPSLGLLQNSGRCVEMYALSKFKLENQHPDIQLRDLLKLPQVQKALWKGGHINIVVALLLFLWSFS